MNRNDVNEKIIATKVAQGMSWADVAAKVGQSNTDPLIYRCTRS